jgi:hypothetical protein
MSCWMSARPDYRPDIDGLRAVAIAAVVVFAREARALRGVLCNRDGCLARVEDRADQLAFWDPSHFTAVGSAWFVEAVAPELLRGI